MSTTHDSSISGKQNLVLSNLRNTGGQSAPNRKPPVKPPVKSQSENVGVASGDEEEGNFSFKSMFHGFGACGTSILVHMSLFVILAVFAVPEGPPKVVTELFSDAVEEEEDFVEFELQEEIETATDETAEATEAAVSIGAEGGGIGSVGTPQMDQQIVERVTANSIAVGPPQSFLPSQNQLVAEVPDGTRGDERFLVDNVDQAMSQITLELLDMLEKSNVLVIWAFDQSESMEEERLEIRDRIDRVYEELGLTGKVKNDRLTTAVVSYGKEVVLNTRKGPTSRSEEIRAAIESVENDPSGEEVMCLAVGTAISHHRKYCQRQKRRMAVILLTDESGNPADNDMHMEDAIREARDAKCSIYTLGRESVFGYPHARMRWLHPQTNRWHHLLIDRGPETAFPEQLQIDGFRRRWDAFSSGFGPYEQTRMANETGGVFFMLPTEEKLLVAGKKTRYELEAMRSYKPDLRSKLENYQDRDTYPLRSYLWQVVSDLNPLESREKARVLEMRIHFSLDRGQFEQQKNAEQVKAINYLKYLANAEKILIDNQRLREQEVAPRWQGNYDLILAQLVTFQIRMYEYGVYLDWFMQNPKTALPVRGEAVLNDWAIGRRRLTFAENEELWKDYPQREKVLQYIERAKVLLQTVIDNHPGTPWAARAKWELDHGFGVELRPHYVNRERNYTGTPIPPPKL